MNGILQDLRFALRSLRRTPGFAMGVVLVLALGIGANTAMFTVLRATLLRPLAYKQPGQLINLQASTRSGDSYGTHLADMSTWQARTHGLQGVAYYAPQEKLLTSSTVQQQLTAVDASANLFSVLGIAPALGRTFTAAEQQPGREHVVILSDPVWRTQFAADPHVLGRTARLDDDLVTIIGVMPRGFAFPADQATPPQIWEPVALNPVVFQRGFDAPAFQIIARRSPGETAAQLGTELTAIQRSLLPLYTAQLIGPEMLPSQVVVTDYRQSLNIGQRKATLALTAAVGLLWLIACADVASLSLARAAARRRDAAVRSALGATRWRLLRQGWAEALLLSAAGGVLGLALSQATLAFFRHRLTQTFGLGLAWHVDVTVLLGLLALSLLGALVFGTVPVLFASQRSLEQALRTDGAQAGTSRSQHRLQRALVAGELALTLCLLVGCGLMLRTVLALRQVPLGFRTDHVFSITPQLPAAKYRNLDPNALVYQPLARRLRTLPGVQALAVTTVAPLAGRFDMDLGLSISSFGDKGSSTTHSLQAKLRAAGPELQQVLGFRMVQGRFFNATDTPSSQPVAVVNRAFAKLYAPAGDITHFSLGNKDRAFHVVGIIDDFHQQGIAEPAAPEIDLNAAQMRPTDEFYQSTLEAHAEILLRSTRDPRDLLPELRHALVTTNPDLAGARIQTMDEIVEDAMGSQLLAEHLLEALGGLALLVALTGLYSLLAYLVTLRTRELGVRLALGAQRGQILTLVLRGAGGLLLIGVGLGVALSLAGAHLLSRFLYGVKAYDVRTFTGAALALLLVGLAAAFVPARHAAAIEPTEALRAE